ALVATDDLGVVAGRTGQSATLADLQLDVMDDRADRQRAHRSRVAGLHVDRVTGKHRVADSQALRRQDVGLLAVLILDQGDEGGAVRIVFEPLDGRRDAGLAATLEVDETQRPLVTTAAETDGDAAGVVAATRGRKALGQ